MRLNQVTAAAADLDASIAFYELLGLRLIVKSTHYARFELPQGEATFSLHLADGPIPTENAPQLYFEVADVDFEVHRLRLAGLLIDQEPQKQRWLWYEAWLRDPAGNAVCIYRAGENRRYPPWRIDAQPKGGRFHLIVRAGEHWTLTRAEDGEDWRAFQSRFPDFKTSLGPFELYELLAMLEEQWPALFLEHQHAIRAFASSDARELAL